MWQCISPFDFMQKIRVSHEVEEAGLDMHEHGGIGYYFGPIVKNTKERDFELPLDMQHEVTVAANKTTS